MTDSVFAKRLADLTDEAIRKSLAEIQAEFDRRFSEPGQTCANDPGCPCENCERRDLDASTPYPVEERAFHVVKRFGDGDTEVFCAKDRATLSSYPAPDRDHAYWMADSLNTVVRHHVERASAAPPADGVPEPVAYAPKGHLKRYLKGRNTACWVYGSPTAEDDDVLYDAAPKAPTAPIGELNADRISAGLKAWIESTPDIDLSPRMMRDAADFILGQPRDAAPIGELPLVERPLNTSGVVYHESGPDVTQGALIGEAGEPLQDIVSEAQFLCDRLDELEWSDGPDGYKETVRDFFGHCEPPLERIKALLAALGEQGGS